MSEELHATVKRTVAARVDELLRRLGIPGYASVHVDYLDDHFPSYRALRLSVFERNCPYAASLETRAIVCVRGTEGDPIRDVTAWSGLSEKDGGPSIEQLADVLSWICHEAIAARCSVLLGPENLSAYLEELPGVHSAEDGLAPLLKDVLDLKISITDRVTVGRIYEEHCAQDRDALDTLDRLIRELRPRSLDLFVAPGYLEEITSAFAGAEYFASVRDTLFYDLGLRFPDFQFVPERRLEPDQFSLAVNHVPALPHAGLPVDCVFAADSVAVMDMYGIDAAPAQPPTSGTTGAVIAASDRAAAESHGVDVYDPIWYMAQCIGVDLRRSGECFVDGDVVERRLAQFESSAPDLVSSVRLHVPIATAAAVMRHLAAEGISLRHFSTCLDRILDFDYVVADPSEFIIFGDALASPVPPDGEWLRDPRTLSAFVRTGLKRYISFIGTRGSRTLFVYLLEPQIEQLLAARVGAAGPDEDLRGRILRAAYDELEPADTTATRAVLTTSSVRMEVHDILAPAFPDMPVLAYDELEPDLTVHPIARITLD